MIFLNKVVMSERVIYNYDILSGKLKKWKTMKKVSPTGEPFSVFVD